MHPTDRIHSAVSPFASGFLGTGPQKSRRKRRIASIEIVERGWLNEMTAELPCPGGETHYLGGLDRRPIRQVHGDAVVVARNEAEPSVVGGVAL